MRGKLQKRHSWTDEELNILSYLRHTRHWRFKQIQTSYFPSLSPSALLGAYWRLSTEDRIRRASRTTIPITAPRNTVKDFPGAPKAQPGCSSIEQGTSRSSCPASGTLTRSENNIGTLALSPPSLAGGCEPFISNNSDSSRYELRPNRPSTFPPRNSQYLVDRRRFPHFFRSYKYSLDLQGLSDSDYIPPSRMPTPSSSDRSVTIASSLPSAASSLELFGLEVRSLQSSDRESATSDRPNDVSSPDFFSSEEHPLPT
ncbi:uncharacterized protein N7506_005498 [Penicillium brevicompactum]|uniref:uncharacterized protein n=1 Tax=Penicillium brevicompactum TaxID=5074 RepID=UPI002541AA03|nr:uncharacterized protein N7506_005498 [Penicillium brevicompactum]KAJ5337476.1 hypothetical protein N7506_005498 [Penicillium brevicompactum]